MLAVAGGKGGCGKTTTALALALAAARAGRTALAVDADVDCPDLARLAGVATPAGVRPRGDRAVDPEGSAGWHRSPEPVAVPGAEGASVVPAPGGPSDPCAFERHRGEADLVVVDCPAGAGPDAVAPLRAADRTLVVTTATRAALRDAAKSAAMSRAVGTPVVGAVVTRCRTPPDGVESLVEAPVLGGIPTARNPVASDSAKSTYDDVFGRLTRQRRYKRGKP